MEFSIAWMTDQLISLGGAFKDLEYTACYYIYDVQKHNTDQEYVCNFIFFFNKYTTKSQ